MTTAMTRSARLRRLALVAASVLLAGSAAACGSSSGSSGGGGEASDSEKAKWAETAYPEPDEAKMKEYATRLMNPEVDVTKLAPEIQTALMVAHTPLTAAQQKVFDKCMTQDTCETGTGKYYLAIVDDQVNSYYSVSRAETTAYAIKTGAIAKISYNTVNMNVQQYLSNFRTAIGQKADLIVSNFGGLGNQAGQVIAQAKAAGIPMTNGVATLSEDVMSKLSVQFSANLCDMWANGAQSIADKLEEEGKPLTYSLFTGPAGNAYAAFWQPCAEKALDDAGMKKVYTGNTEWTPQGTVKAAAALRASNKKPSLIAYDTFPENFMQAYIDANDKDMPAFALTGASDIGTAKTYKDAQDKGLDPIIFVSPNNTWLSSIELSINLAIKDGKGPSSTKIDWPVNFSDFEQFMPQFDLSQNNFAFLGSPLSAEEQALALKQ